MEDEQFLRAKCYIVYMKERSQEYEFERCVSLLP